jgi:predicted kinase
MRKGGRGGERDPRSNRSPGGRGGGNRYQQDPATALLKNEAALTFGCTEGEVFTYHNVQDPFNIVNSLTVAICKKEGPFSGSMLIASVNKEEIKQIVYSTPTIPLIKSEFKYVNGSPSHVYFANKWNGENITFFKYYDIGTNVYISVRSRGFPFLSDTPHVPYITLVQEVFFGKVTQTNNLFTVENLPEQLLPLVDPDIQSITFELCGSSIPQLVSYDFKLRLQPLFVTDMGGRITPNMYQEKDSVFKDKRISELCVNIGKVPFDLKAINQEVISFRKKALTLNESYRTENNCTSGYAFNNFVVEGKVIYLLGEDDYAVSRHEGIFKIKPDDIELSHSVMFDQALQFKALEGLSKLYSKGNTLTEQNMKKELNMTERIWKSFGNDIMELVQGVPNLSAYKESPQKMLIMVGVPGSGKSTVANRLLTMNKNWVRVNQDELKTRKACEKVARDNLKKGKSVIVDRCNFDIKQRNVWIKIASEFSVTDIRCLHFKIPLETCKKRIVIREDHPTIPKGDSGIQIIDNFSSIFVPPSNPEGFVEILSAADDTEIEAAISKLSKIASIPEREVTSPKKDKRFENNNSDRKKQTGNTNAFALLGEDN